MIKVRKAADRGSVSFGWLQSRHTFSFGQYHDPAHMGFGVLRVINEDRVAPGAGFEMHGHRDMEIISYVLDGALEHRDSLRTGSVIRPGEVQRMSAGTGILHSEFNLSDREPVHFLQIWLLPEREGLAPGYEQQAFTDAELRGRLHRIGGRDGGDGGVIIHQDVDLYAGRLDPGEGVRLALDVGRTAWVQVARGAVVVNGEGLAAGDGAAITDAAAIVIEATAGEGRDTAEVLVFDMAAGSGPAARR